MPTVGFIGVGRVGEPMVERLLAAGHDVWFHSRRPAITQRLQLLGGRCVDASVDLASRDVVISCLYSDSQMLDVAPAIIDAMMPGSIFVSHTTGTTTALQQLAVVAGNGSVGVVDAGFSGNVESARAGALTLFLGGAPADVDRAAGVLTAYGSVVIRAGDLGAGMLIKILNNLLFAAISQSTLIILESGSRSGIDEAALLRAMSASSGASAAAQMIQSCGGAKGTIERVEPYMRKDVDVASRMAAGFDADVEAVLVTALAGPMDLTSQGDR